MAKDIFGSEAADVSQAFSADSSSLTFQGTNDAEIASLLIQSLSANYAQTITRVYELSSAASTFIRGRTQGTITLGRIIGPAKTGSDFIEKFASVCDLKKNNIIFNLNAKQQEEGCAEGSDEGFIAAGCVIVSLAYTVSSQEMVIQQTVQMQVISLEKTKEKR